MKYNIIKTENYLLVVDDSEIKEGNWYFDSTDKAALNPIYKRSQDLIEEYYGCKKIIAHLPLNNSPILEGVPLLPPLEDEVEKLAFDYTSVSQSHRRGFIDGYNKAKENNKPIPNWIYSRLCVYDKRNPDYLPYDEDDLTKKPTNCSCDNCFYGRTKMADFIIQSLQQPKMPVAFECEMEYVDNHDYMDFEDGSTLPSSIQYITTPKTTTNSQGQTVWVGTYKFE